MSYLFGNIIHQLGSYHIATSKQDSEFLELSRGFQNHTVHETKLISNIQSHLHWSLPRFDISTWSVTISNKLKTIMICIVKKIQIVVVINALASWLSGDLSWNRMRRHYKHEELRYEKSSISWKKYWKKSRDRFESKIIANKEEE